MRTAAGVLILLLVAAPAAHGQLAATCGWHFLDPTERPPTLAALLSRQDPSPEVLESVARLEQWYRGCDGTDARVAAFDLKRLRARTNSSDPQLRALIALAELRGPDVQVPRAEGETLRPAFEGTNAANEGVRLLSAVAEETGWPEVAEELGLVTLAVRHPPHLRTARATLASRKFDGNARIRTLLAEIDLALEQVERAGSVLDAAAGSDVRAQRLAAVEASILNRSPRQYLDALAAAGPAELQVFYDDLRLLLDPAEIAEWEALPGAQRSEWIRRKWEWRAMMAGIDVEQRIAEHHRRMQAARKLFPRRGFRGAPPLNGMWRERPGIVLQPLDDRGLIYLRHGPPTREISMRAPAGSKFDRPLPGKGVKLQAIASDVLAWYYGEGLAGGGVYEFARIDDRTDYFLIEPSPVCGVQKVHVLDQGNTSGYSVPVSREWWSTQLAALDPSLALYYDRCDRASFLAAGQFIAERAEAREHAEIALATETATPRYTRPLAGALNLYGFRNSRGGEVVAYFGLPGDSLESVTGSAGVEYGLRLRLAGGDPASLQVARKDSLLRFMQPARLPRGSVVSAWMSLPLPEGSNSRVVLSVVNAHDSAQGQVMSATRALPAGGAGMVLSDIVVAHDRDGIMHRAGNALAPVLGHAVTAGEQVRVYYEMYGVADGAPLQVDIEISPGEERSLLGSLQDLIRRRAAVAVQFTEAAEPDASGMLPVLRTIGLDVEPGRYELLVRVKNLETDVVVQGRTNLVVLRPGQGN